MPHGEVWNDTRSTNEGHSPAIEVARQTPTADGKTLGVIL